MKKIQIPEELFVNLVKYFLLDMNDTDTYNTICKGIKAKYEAIEKHNLYTTYKTASTQEQAEKARQEYLDKIGMRESFRR